MDNQSRDKVQFAVDKAESRLPYGLQLNIQNPRQGSTLERFDLSIDLVCGHHPLPEGSSLAFRQCRVQAVLEGCGIERGTAYSYAFQQGRLEQSRSEVMAKSHSLGAGGKAEAKVGFSAMLPSFGASAEAKAEGDISSTQKATEETKLIPPMPLISFVAGNSWVVGAHKTGDWRMPGGFLFGEYFGEEKEEGSPKVACYLTAEPNAAAVAVTVGLAVRSGDLWLLEDGDASRVSRDDGGLAERIAAMVLLKGQKRKGLKDKDVEKFQGELPEGHVLIALGRLTGCKEVGDV